MILNSRIIGSSNKKIIILHGLLGSLDNWITFGKKLSLKDYEVHLIDQRNHGKSFHSDEFSYKHMSNDLKNYLDFHKIKQRVLDDKDKLINEIKKNQEDQLQAGHHGVPLSVFRDKFFFGQDKFSDLFKELKRHGLK